MKCPKCKHINTRVLDSRVIEDWTNIKRRRECEKCWYRFTTFEKVSIDILILKKNWDKEIYDRIKLKKSILLAFANREITDKKIEFIIDNLENKRIWQWKEIKTKTIWQDILKELKKIDLVAYIRFASVYMQFESIEDFKKILKMK